MRIDEDLEAGRLAFVPIQGGHAPQSVALVHRATGPLEPVVTVLAGFIAAGFAPASEEP